MKIVEQTPNRLVLRENGQLNLIIAGISILFGLLMIIPLTLEVLTMNSISIEILTPWKIASVIFGLVVFVPAGIITGLYLKITDLVFDKITDKITILVWNLRKKEMIEKPIQISRIKEVFLNVEIEEKWVGLRRHASIVGKYTYELRIKSTEQNEFLYNFGIERDRIYIYNINKEKIKLAKQIADFLNVPFTHNCDKIEKQSTIIDETW